MPVKFYPSEVKHFPSTTLPHRSCTSSASWSGIVLRNTFCARADFALPLNCCRILRAQGIAAMGMIEETSLSNIELTLLWS